MYGETQSRYPARASVRIHAHALLHERWALTVTDHAGDVVRQQSGTSATGGAIATGWDARTDDSTPAPVGSYTLTLTTRRGSAAGLPFTTAVAVLPAVTVSGPATAGYGATVRLHGDAAPGVEVSVAVSGLATTTTTASQAGHWSSTFVADADHTWMASASGTTTAPGSTRVVPTVVHPQSRGGDVFGTGSPLMLTGTASPTAQTVEAVSRGSVIAGPVPVNADGTWSLPVPLPASLRFQVVGGDGRGSPTYTAWRVRTVTTHAPARVGSHRTLVVTGTVHRGPSPVQLLVGRHGSALRVVDRSVASSTGRFRLHLRDLTHAVRWRVVSRDGATVLARSRVGHTRLG